MKLLLYISLLFSPLMGFTQTTTNLILNNDFEAINITSPLYQPSSHAASLRDTNFNTTPVPCWVYANYISQIVNYDSFSVSSRPNVQLNSIYPQHSYRALSFFTGSFYSSGPYEIEPPISLMTTKFSSPLTAGVTYLLSGYINVYLDSFNSAWAGSAPVGFSHIKHLGINFSSNKLYFDNPNYAPDVSPTLTYDIDSFTYQGPYNPWHKFEIAYTASGGERYLTLGNFDTTRANVKYYPADDSIRIRYFHGIPFDSFDFTTILYLDNLTLIPFSDTSLTVINPHIAPRDSILLTHDTLVCGNGPLTLTTAATYWSYAWSTGDITQSTHITTPGTYSVTVDNGCAVYADTIIILPDTTMRSGYTIPDTSICTDRLITYTLPDSFLADHISWSSGDSGITAALTAGTHTLSLSNQCFTFSDTFTIHYTGSDTVHLFPDTTAMFCPGQVYTFSALRPYPSYLWSDHTSLSSIAVSQSGYYSLTVTDTAGCPISDTIHYAQPILPTILLTQDSIRKCASDYPITITAEAGFSQYYWNGLPGTNQYVITAPDVTVYASATTLCGTVRDTFAAYSIHDLTGIAYTIDSDCTQNTATISLSTVGSPTVLWSNGLSGDQVTISLPQQLIVLAQYTCTAIADTIILPGCAFFTHTLYIPNAFSPNGDGTNDYFEIFGDKYNIKYLSVAIFDRWGEKVFESNDTGFRWDGRYKGALLDGVLVYDIAVVYTDDKVSKAKGSLTLIR